jgi:hypothetical protein
MMIKKYNAFVEGKVNEEFVMADPRPGTTELPGTIEKPGVMPETPTPIRKDRTSPVPAPAKAELEPKEVEGGDVYSDNLMALSELLPGSTVSNNSVIYKAENGEEKTILFPSETFNDETGEGIFHVDKKKFKTAQEVANYLENSTPVEEVEIEKDHSPSKEDMDEFIKDEKQEEEEFESKSYKSTRKFESFKNKKK